MAEWQTRCLQAAVIFDRAGSTPANRTIFTMDATLIETLKQWNITTVLPLSVGDFQLLEEYRMIEKDGKPVEYRLFTYENHVNGWTVRAILNPESEEFSIRTDIGKLEFALNEFLTDSFALFRSMVEERLGRIIHDDYGERSRNFSVILKNKGVPDVAWDEFLPDSYQGFRRLVKPNDAVRIINGSYMILAYYDAATRSGLSLMYNVLRDDFFAERRVQNFPNLVHDFDTSSLKELEKALRKRLLPVLDEIAADRDKSLSE